MRGGISAVAGRLLVAIAVTVLWLVPAPASAVPTTQTIRGEYLRIESVADWDAATTLAPGEVVLWDLAISAVPPEPSTVRVGIQASGGAPLRLTIRSCTTAWEENACPGDARDLRSDWEIPRDGSPSPLLSMASDETTHIRLEVQMAEPSELATQVTVSATVAQETVTVNPHPGASTGDLASTGAPIETQIVLAVCAAGVLFLGATLVVRSRRREEEDLS